MLPVTLIDLQRERDRENRGDDWNVMDDARSHQKAPTKPRVKAFSRVYRGVKCAFVTFGISLAQQGFRRDERGAEPQSDYRPHLALVVSGWADGGQVIRSYIQS